MWDACKVGAIMGQKERNQFGFLPSAPSSIKSQWIAGVTALCCLQWNQVQMGEGEHGGTIVSPSSPRQPLRSFCKSEQPLELLQNPSIAQEAFEHPTTRRCRSVPHCPHKLITLAGLHMELNSWRTVPPLSPPACPLPCTWLHRLACAPSLPEA